jgi:hypothetical protein
MENQEKNLGEVELKINKQPSFTETWYEGSVTYQGEEHKFWLIDPKGADYEVEVRWFFKQVPREVRGLYNQIAESFKRFHYDNPSAESSN